LCRQTNRDWLKQPTSGRPTLVLTHSMGVIFSAPVLPLDVATIAAALESTGQLDWLVTRWCLTRAELPYARKLPVPNSWLRRLPAPVSSARLRRSPVADVRSLLGPWLDRDRIQTTDKSFRLVDKAAASLVTGDTTAIIGREDACFSCFRRGEEFGIPRIYQLPTAHYATVQKLLSRERDLFPEAFDGGELEADFAAHRMERKAAELSSATHVLCPSSFVGESLRTSGIRADRITVLPLGIDPVFTGDGSVVREPVFLYVGTISVRKGVHRLIKVWKHLRAYKTHRLRLIGDLRLPRSFVADYRDAFEHIPRVARASLAAEYSKAQAFVFNALADGFGHVFAEAMACATPVLASCNSGAPDLINHDEEGWIFDYGDDGALAAVLDRALSCTCQLRQMGERARHRAREWTSSHFATAFLSWLSSILERNP